MDGLASAIGGGSLPQGDDDPLNSPFAPRKRREEPKGLFDLPDDPLKEGEATAQAVAENIAWLRREGVDARCDAYVLGTVPDVFARFSALLDERSLEVSRLRGVWVVPPFVLKDIDAQVRWHTVRGRVAPFLKNDYLGRIDGELRTGAAIDWRAMGMQAFRAMTRCASHAAPHTLRLLTQRLTRCLTPPLARCRPRTSSWSST